MQEAKGETASARFVRGPGDGGQAFARSVETDADRPGPADPEIGWRGWHGVEHGRASGLKRRAVLLGEASHSSGEDGLEGPRRRQRVGQRVVDGRNLLVDAQ